MKTAQQRQGLYKTGGGPSTTPNLNTIEEKVLAVCSNISGLDARNDSDSIKVQVQVQEKEHKESHDVLEANGLNEPLNILNTAEQIIKESVDANDLNDERVNGNDKWRSWNTKALKSKPSKTLKPQSLKASVTAQLDALSDVRLQMVKLQMKTINDGRGDTWTSGSRDGSLSF
ncbi:unnamed protein product [Arctia plantaginis]|uniref:Uncharacterized protein n=1 Tax=Arctia plantaginis TaxID=874455 RepID=A0A8S0YTQ0_ARCPL|nr:unnamed protein product [Arctia plantaginis]